MVLRYAVCTFHRAKPTIHRNALVDGGGMPQYAVQQRQTTKGASQ
jgi:hypothetical protein